MAYDEALAARVRALLPPHPALAEQKMFGGLAFLYERRMFAGVSGDELMLRPGTEAAARAVGEPGVRYMDMTGRSMRSIVMGSPAVVAPDEDLERRVTEALAFVMAEERRGGGRVRRRGKARP